MLFIWYERDEVEDTAGDIGAAYGPAAQIAVHAGAGCISSVAQGGKCGHGAAGAVAGVGTGMVMGHSWASAVIGGGLGSVAAGGSFEDGAVMGAMGHAFNHLFHVGANIRIPAWIGKLISGENYHGQGGGFGLAISWPGDAGGEFDIGVYGQVNGSGFDYGTGKGSIGVGYERGGLRLDQIHYLAPNHRLPSRAQPCVSFDLTSQSF